MMETTNEDPLKVKLTSVVAPDGDVSHHVVVEIEGARIVFDNKLKRNAVEDAITYLNRLAESGSSRLKRLL